MAAPLKPWQTSPRNSVDDYEFALDTDSLLASDNGSEQVIAPQDVRLKRYRSARIRWMVIGVLVVLLVLLLTILSPKKPTRELPPLPEPVVTQLQPEFFTEYNSNRVRVRYGPFLAPSNNIHNGMQNFRIMNVQMPCHGCLITWFHAGLEYPDGSYANATTGLWLHHTVLANKAKRDARSCEYNQRFFASGNERTVADMTLNGTEKAGYWLDESDEVVMLTELMNEYDKPQVAILTITYEYIPYMPTEFDSITPIWLDIGGCEQSDQPVLEKANQFSYSSPAWKSTISGRVTAILSHLHDGGAALNFKSDGHTVCESIPTYENGMHQGEMSARMDMSHISFMPACYNIGQVHKGDELTIQADYDLSSHPPMMNGDGTPEGVMGIAVLYVIED